VGEQYYGAGGLSATTIAPARLCPACGVARLHARKKSGVCQHCHARLACNICGRLIGLAAGGTCAVCKNVFRLMAALHTKACARPPDLARRLEWFEQRAALKLPLFPVPAVWHPERRQP
jgi:hypothetical protein